MCIFFLIKFLYRHLLDPDASTVIFSDGDVADMNDFQEFQALPAFPDLNNANSDFSDESGFIGTSQDLLCPLMGCLPDSTN